MAYVKQGAQPVQPTSIERVNGLSGVSVDLVERGLGLPVVRLEDGRIYQTAAIVEYEASGSQIYAKDVNGIVYTNSSIYEERFQKEINERLMGSYQSHQPITTADMYAMLHCQSYKNNDMFHSILFADGNEFMVNRNGQYHTCQLHEIEQGEDILVFGVTSDMVTGAQQTSWRGIQVDDIKIVDGEVRIAGFEFQHTNDGSKQYMGPCAVSNVDYAHEIEAINQIGLDAAYKMLERGEGFGDIEIDRGLTHTGY